MTSTNQVHSASAAQAQPPTLFRRLGLLAAACLTMAALHSPPARAQAPSPNAVTAVTAGSGASVDRALVGRWTQESIINSGGGAGGFASFSTVRTLVLAHDGRVRQSVRSAGGGGNWSHASNEELEFSGRWQVRGTEIWVQPDGYPQYVAAGRYALIDGRLVVYDGRGRQIWSR
jgi:hypothetical protein